MTTISIVNRFGAVEQFELSVKGDKTLAIAKAKAALSGLLGEKVELQESAQEIDMFGIERKSFFWFDYQGKRPIVVVTEYA